MRTVKMLTMSNATAQLLDSRTLQIILQILGKQLGDLLLAQFCSLTGSLIHSDILPLDSLKHGHRHGSVHRNCDSYRCARARQN